MLEIERKFLVTGPVEVGTLPAPVAVAEMEQTYLLTDDGSSERVRAISVDGVQRYRHTVKRKVATGVREEVEVEIDAGSYQRLLGRADPERVCVRKRRFTFTWAGRVFELDELVEPVQLWLLEVELADAEGLTAELELPPMVPVEREVTADDAYGNSELARRR